MSEIALYADGGLVGAQPKTLAGTWAYVIVINGVAWRPRPALARVTRPVIWLRFDPFGMA